MEKPNPEHTCFVISPIGQADSDVRKHADKVLNYVIKRSLEPLGYKVVRADAISEPGTINLQVMKRIVDAEIVVADLTGTNPNVMYELAIRHAIRKPVILLIKNGEKIPFDIAAERTIFYDLGDIESVDKARDELAQQTIFIKNKEFKIDTPFSMVEGLLATSKSSEKEVDNWTVALDDIGFIKSTVKKLLDKQVETDTGKFAKSPKQPITSWKKIRIEFPSENDVRGYDVMDISSEQSIANFLNDVYFLLHENKSSKFKPAAYTYLWDWILIRKKDGMPLIIKGIQNNIGAFDFFSDGETWEIRVLDEPLLNNAERFNLKRGKSNS
jgi:hypothetical protein